MEALKECVANFVVYLHPSKAKKVEAAVYRELSSLLFKHAIYWHPGYTAKWIVQSTGQIIEFISARMRCRLFTAFFYVGKTILLFKALTFHGFNEALDGVVLTYEPKFSSNLAKILPGTHPYFGVRFEAKLLLFNPKPEMLLEGEVVKVGQQSIHIIVLGFSSAVVADEDIREDFKYKIKHGKKVFVSRSHKKHRIKVGTTLRFSVKNFDEEILHICGSLIPANTGNVQWLETKAEESQAYSITEKRIGNKRAAELLEPDNLVPYREKLKSENNNKKSRRSKSRHS